MLPILLVRAPINGCLSSLKVGGWIELQDLSLVPHLPGDLRSLRDTPIYNLSEELTRAANQLGTPFCVSEYMDLLDAAGFQDIRVRTQLVPCN